MFVLTSNYSAKDSNPKEQMIGGFVQGILGTGRAGKIIHMNNHQLCIYILKFLFFY